MSTIFGAINKQNTFTEPQTFQKDINVDTRVLVREKEVVVKEHMMQSGTINFVNSRRSIIVFARPFKKVPHIILTMLNASVTNPFTTAITRTGFTCNFQNNWTGACSYLALER